MNEISLLRPRLIATLLIIDRLAHISYGYSRYEYVGDPINILNLLSGFEVDEVLVIDLTASQSNHLNIQLLTKFRAVADFPLSYAGGIRSTSDADRIMKIGFDKIFLSACNPNLSTLMIYISNLYGIQAVALSIDYAIASNQRYMYNPYIRSNTNTTLEGLLNSLQSNLVSDLLFSCVDRAASNCGVDQILLNESYISELSNPIILSGGFSTEDNQFIKLHGVSGLAASSSIFLQSGCSSALVCLERHFCRE